jgi:hypothetical protein
MKATTIEIQDKTSPVIASQLEDSGLQEKISNGVDELLSVLDKDIQHIQKSLSWLNELRGLVIKRDYKELSKLLQTIQTEADSYAATESQRLSLRKDLANALGCNIKQVTLSALAAALPEEKKVRIENRKIKLKGLIQELRKEHLSTTLLLSDCARFIRQILKALFDLGGKRTVFYSPNGAARKLTETTFVNMKL